MAAFVHCGTNWLPQLVSLRSGIAHRHPSGCTRASGDLGTRKPPIAEPVEGNSLECRGHVLDACAPLYVEGHASGVETQPFHRLIFGVSALPQAFARASDTLSLGVADGPEGGSPGPGTSIANLDHDDDRIAARYDVELQSADPQIARNERPAATLEISTNLALSQPAESAPQVALHERPHQHRILACRIRPRVRLPTVRRPALLGGHLVTYFRVAVAWVVLRSLADTVRALQLSTGQTVVTDEL